MFDQSPTERIVPSEHLNALIAEYLRRVDAGDQVDIDQICSRHPELADALRSFIASEDAVAGPSKGRDTSESRTVETIAPRKSRSGRSIAAGSKFGRYTVTRLLGQGAMGSVYLAQDTQLQRQVALKLPNLTEFDRDELFARFEREARAAARLSHPNICPIYDIGEHDGTPYLTMGFIDGQPLSRNIGTPALSDPRLAVHIARQIARAIEHAHQNGVVHRDLKPGNVLIDKDGKLFVTDFGLARRIDTVDPEARLTQEGMIVGTPAYMPPEQIEGKQDLIGPKSDIYALGAILFEMLTGDLPFRGSMANLVASILRDPTPKPSSRRPGLDPQLDAMCLKMLHKNPAQRYASMREVAADLDGWMKGKPSLEKPLSPVHDTGRAVVKSPSSGAGFRSLVPTAKQLIEKHDYAQAAQLLGQIAPADRTPQISALLKEATKLEDEAKLLISELRQAVQARNLDGIRENLDRLLELKPGNQFARELDDALQTYGAGKRFRFDDRGRLLPAERGSWLNGLSLGIAIGFFALVGVSSAVTLYLKDDRQAVKVEVDETLLRDGALTLIVEGKSLEVRGVGETIHLKPGPHGYEVRRGDQIVIAPSQYVVRKGDRNILTIGAVAAVPGEIAEPERKTVENVAPQKDPPAPVPATPAPLAGVAPSGLFAAGDGKNVLPGLLPRPSALPGVRRWQLTSLRSPGSRRQITSIEWNPKHNLVAASFVSGEIRIFDAQKRSLESVWYGHTNPPGQNIGTSSIDWSPDGERILSVGADGAIVIWTRQGAIEKRVRDRGDPLRFGIWAPDGKGLVTGGYGVPLQFWNSDGTEIETPGATLRGADACAWTPDGERLAVAGNDRFIHLYDRNKAETGKFKIDSTPLALAWANNGQVLASIDYTSQMRLYTATGEKLESATVQQNPSHLIGSIDGKMLISSGSSVSSMEIRLMGPQGALIRGIPTAAERIGINRDSTQIAFGDSFGRVGIAQVDSGAISILQEKVVDYAPFAAWTQDGRKLAVTSSSGAVHVFDAGLRQIEQIPAKPSNGLAGLAWDNAGEKLIRVGSEGGINLIAPTTGKAMSAMGHPSRPTWSPDGRYFSMGTFERHLHIFDTQSDATSTVTIPQTESVVSSSWSSDGKTLAVVATGLKGSIRLYDVTTPSKPVLSRELFDSDTARMLRNFAWHPKDPQRFLLAGQSFGGKPNIVVAGTDQKILVSLLSHLKSPGDVNATIIALCWSPDGKKFATAGGDELIRIWSADGPSGGDPLATLFGHRGWVQSLNWGKDKLASGSTDGNIILWNSDGTPENVIVPVDEGRSLLRFSAGGQLMSGNEQLAEENVVAVVENMEGGFETLRMSQLMARLDGKAAEPPKRPKPAEPAKVPDLPKNPKRDDATAPARPPLSEREAVEQLRKRYPKDLSLVVRIGDSNGNVNIGDKTPLPDGLFRVESVSFQEARGVDDRALELLQWMGSLQTLNFTKFYGEGDGFRHVSKLGSLSAINFFEVSKLSPGAFAELRKCPSLKSLSIGSNEWEDDTLEHMHGLIRLESLSIRGSQISSKALALLPALPRLRSLGLVFMSRNLGLKDSEIAALGRFPELTGLSVVAAPTFTGAGFEKAGSLAKLTSLHFQDAPDVTAEGFSAIARACPNLRSLSFMYGPKVDEPSMKAVATLKSMQDLMFHSCEMTDEALSRVADVKGLQGLTLAYGKGFSAAGMSRFGEMQSLTSLSLSHVNIGDDCCEPIAKLNAVSNLHLDFTGVTIAGARKLSQMPKLIGLDLRGTKTTRDELAPLKDAMPNCRIDGP